MESSRREALLLGITASAASALPTTAFARPAAAGDGIDCHPGGSTAWATGIEGKRKADLGNGQYRNPVLSGDHPDPSILRDGDVWYKVSSSFVYYPGLVVWQSRDLVNWSPVGPALTQPVGSVFAPDIARHGGRYYIYFPALNFPSPGDTPDPAAPKRPILATYVVHAASMAGPWSDPVDMGIADGIDPGHVVGEDGKRYLFLSGGKLVPISNDGLARAGATQDVYAGWAYPQDWVLEGFSLEGPKLLRRGDWFYLFAAEGGTAGPPTSHMVVVARSRSVRGPWENCPHNPIVRTTSAGEPWWSRGHATPVEGPAGDWWLVYHGYENGYRTLGRQMLLEPMAWTADGWPRAMGGDLSRTLAKPAGGKAIPHGVAFSDCLARQQLGAGSTFFKPRMDYLDRARFENGAMALAAQGATPGKSSPLLIDAGDRSYELSVEIEISGGAQGGLLLFYDERFFCGLGSDADHFHPYKMGTEPMFGPATISPGGRFHLRLVNHDNVATFYYSASGTDWITHTSFEVSGYNHNVADGFLSLRPALYAARSGSVTFRNLRYAAIAPGSDGG